MPWSNGAKRKLPNEEERGEAAPTKFRGGGQLRAALTLSKYSLIATLRSPTSVVFSLLFPIFFIIVFGSLVADKGGTIKVAVAVGCDTMSPVYKAVEKIPSVELETGLTPAQIAEAMERGTVTAILNITNDAGLSFIPHYQVSLSAADSASRGMAFLRTAIGAVIGQIDKRVFPRNPSFANLSVMRIPGHLHKAIDFVLPGQLGFSLLMSTAGHRRLGGAVWRGGRVWYDMSELLLWYV